MMIKIGPNVEKNKRIPVGANPYHFYLAHKGFSFAGVCENEHCKAFNEPVTCKRGEGYDESFCPCDDVYAGEYVPKCPGCGQQFKVRTWILYRCQAKIEYIKKESDKKKERNTPLILNFDESSRDSVRILGIDKNNVVHEMEYRYLKVSVHKPNAKKGCLNTILS